MKTTQEAVDSLENARLRREWLAEYGPGLWAIWKKNPGKFKEWLTEQIMEES